MDVLAISRSSAQGFEGHVRLVRSQLCQLSIIANMMRSPPYSVLILDCQNRGHPSTQDHTRLDLTVFNELCDIEFAVWFKHDIIVRGALHHAVVIPETLVRPSSLHDETR